MADIPLFNNLQYFFLIDDDDAAGAAVAAPPGDVNSVTSGSTAITMTVETMPSGPSAGAPAVHCIPTVIQSDASNAGGGITCLLTDTAGLPMPVIPTFSVSPNPAPVALALDTATVVTVTQAVPTLAGPAGP